MFLSFVEHLLTSLRNFFLQNYPSFLFVSLSWKYLVIIEEMPLLSCLTENTLMPLRITVPTLWAYLFLSRSSAVSRPTQFVPPKSPPVRQGHLGQTFYCGLCALATGRCGSHESSAALWMGLIHRHIFQILFLKLAYNPPWAILQKLMRNLNKWTAYFCVRDKPLSVPMGG